METSKRAAHDPVPQKEDALTPELHRRKREVWLEENREAIEAYNEHVRQHGVFSAGLRGF
ncbi:MAG TPA: type II toxin-antitoxin system CcdA family antitoxin [Thermoanaerobaculia bacterium]|nr:type II toxin-antitoxin system CcdA family antitoxin [Thermoanaerobaculia bacterium]